MLHTTVQPADVMVSGLFNWVVTTTCLELQDKGQRLFGDERRRSVVAAMATLQYTAILSLCLHVRVVVSCSHCLQHTACMDTSNSSL
jgi:hypothetical protein